MEITLLSECNALHYSRTTHRIRHLDFGSTILLGLDRLFEHTIITFFPQTMVTPSTSRASEARPNTLASLEFALTALLSNRYCAHIMLPSVRCPLIVYN